MKDFRLGWQVPAQPLGPALPRAVALSAEDHREYERIDKRNNFQFVCHDLPPPVSGKSVQQERAVAPAPIGPDHAARVTPFAVGDRVRTNEKFVVPGLTGTVVAIRVHAAFTCLDCIGDGSKTTMCGDGPGTYYDYTLELISPAQRDGTVEPVMRQPEQHLTHLLTSTQSEEGWIEHRGDGCPVGENVLVRVLYKDGATREGKAITWIGWRWNGEISSHQIAAYRVLP